MDIRIEKKKGLRALFTRRGIPYLAGAVLLIFVVWLLVRGNSSRLRIDARTISVGEVARGEFNDYIRVTGQVQPITTVQLSPSRRASSSGSWSRRVPRSTRATCSWS